MRAGMWIVLGALVAAGLWWGLREETTSVVRPETADEVPADASPELASRGQADALDVAEPVAPVTDAQVAGRVLLRGQPVAARVELVEVPKALERSPRARHLARAVLATTHATPDAGYRLPAQRDRLYLVRAVLASDPTVQVALPFWGVEHGASADLHLPSGRHALSIHVVDAAGQPVAADVTLEGEALGGLPGSLRGVLPTGADGTLRVGALSEGSVRAWVRAGSQETRSVWAAVPRDGPLRVVLPALRDHLVVEIQDRDTGAPIEAGSTQVLLSGHDAQGRAWTSRATARRGVVRVPTAGGHRALEVHAAGYQPESQDVAPDATTVRVRLVRAPSIAGVVRRLDTGAPVPHARVSYGIYGDSAMFRHQDAHHVQADAQGRYRIPLERWDSWMVWVVDQGVVSEGLGSATGTVNACVVEVLTTPVEDHTLHVVPGGTLVATVQDEAGHPLEGLSLSLDQECLEPDRATSSMSMMEFFRDTPFAREGTSDAQGVVTIEGLVPGWTWTGYGASETHELPKAVTIQATFGETLRPTWTATPREEVIKPEADPEAQVLRVRLVDAKGTAVEGARISFQSHGAYGGRDVSWAWTNAEGRAVLASVAESRGTLRVSHPRFVPLSIVREADETDVERTLTPAAHVVGRVVDAQGKTREGAELIEIKTTSAQSLEEAAEEHARPSDQGLRIGYPSQVQIAWLPDGTFRIGPVPEGRYRIGFHLDTRDGRLEGRAILGAGVPGDVVLEPASTEAPAASDAEGEWGTLIVRGPNGEPLQRASQHVYSLTRGPLGLVTLWGMTGGQRELPSNKRGYWIDVCEPVGAGGRPAPYGGIRVGPFRAGKAPRRIEVRMPPERRLSGVVTRPDGTPAAGHEVKAYTVAVDGYESPRTWAAVQTLTDREGRFVLRQLGALAYDVHVAAGSGTLASFTRTTPKQETVEIRLRAAAEEVLRVLGPDGRGVPEASVLVMKAGESEMLAQFDEEAIRATTNEEGEVRVQGLDRKVARKLVIRAPYKRDLIPLVLDPWTPASGTHVLQAPLAVEGVVRDAAGAPVEGADVRFKPTTGDHGHGRATTDAAGRVRMKGVVPGAGQVEVRLKGGPGTPWRFPLTLPQEEPFSFRLPAMRTLQVAVPRGPAFEGRATLHLLEFDASGTRTRTWQGRTTVDAHAFQGLQADRTYALFAYLRVGDEVLMDWQSDLGANPTAARVAWRAARRTALTFGLPGDAVARGGWIRVIDPPIPWSRRIEDGTSFHLHLPPGRWRLHVRLIDDSLNAYEAEVDVDAGTPAHVDLAAKDG